MKHFLHNITVGLLAAISVASCTEEEIDLPDYTVSGQEVTLSVPITLPVMDKRSRADLDATQLNQVESLWIRTYNAQTGKATSDWIKQTPGSTDTEVARTANFQTLSGLSYIVAVANVSNLAVTPETVDNPQPLSELLEAADTWADFLKIAVVSPSSQENVRAPRPPLPMAGCYSDLNVGGQHPEPARIDEWQLTNFTPYFIPAQKAAVNFTGAIHLRRLVSHLRFNVMPGNDNIKVEVNSYRVMNAPRYSWLYERAATGGMLTNFGDLSTDAADAANYYTDVAQFGSQFITNNSADGSSSFDFWQAENKHTGTCDTYSDRDAKTAGDPVLFTSLTGNTWTPNNEASYVLVNCTVEYVDPINVNQQGEIVAGGEEAYRTGQVTYIVHLGYIGDSPVAQRAKDFNCFRNVDYTYNLTVNGLNDIRLDAYAADATAEAYHGEEGLVVDQTNSTISIDGHYAAFNIYLSQAELTGDFGFIITTYDNGEQITLTDANTQQGSGQNIQILDDAGNVIDPKYYNWIELRPTTAEGVLAEYKPRYGTNADGKTCLLTSLKGGWNDMPASSKSTTGWYTIFVNEYTYEPMYTGTDGYANEQWNGQGGRPNWMHYVNQNPRRFFLRVTQKKSPDGNSIYARSKYGISQQSLQTYYSDQTFAPASGDIPAGTAIAVERENETLGLNIRHTFMGGTSLGNGRWNTGMYLNNSTTSTNLSINSTNASSRPLWDNYIEASQPLEVPEVQQDRLQGGPPIPGRTIANGNPHKIPAMVLETLGATPRFCDPQPSSNYTVQAINACMSRNRDNNGNGRIEPDELRWYVPAINKYIAMVLGEASLPEPLMDFASIPQIPRTLNNSSFNFNSGTMTNDFLTRYMYVGSNDGKNVLWAIEGTSLSGYEQISSWYSGSAINPWNIRCVRNLGSDLRSVTESDKTSTPYIHDASSHTIRMPYFNLATIRSVQYTGNGIGEGLMPVHTLNSPYNNVYYGFEYSTTNLEIPTTSRPDNSSDNNYLSTLSKLTNYINSNPCNAEGANLPGTGWRVPNQEELTIMYNLGILTSGKDNTTWMSCTMNYFNTSGVGSDDLTNKYFLIAMTTQTTMLTRRNYGDAVGGGSDGFFVRCVRDIN